jgi:hypothetical protein
MFKSWYSNFYNQFTKLNNNNNNNTGNSGNNSSGGTVASNNSDMTTTTTTTTTAAAKMNKTGKDFVSNEKVYLSSTSHSNGKANMVKSKLSSSLISSRNTSTFRVNSSNNTTTTNTNLAVNNNNNITKLARSPSSTASSSPSKVLNRTNKALTKSSSLSPKKVSANRKLINPELANSKCSMANHHHHNHNHPASGVSANDNSNIFFNTFQSLVHYGDNIGAKIVKCLINENLYESQSLINQDYDIYQVSVLVLASLARQFRKFLPLIFFFPHLGTGFVCYI